MKIQPVAVLLTVLNLIILTIILAQIHPVKAQQRQQDVPKVLRARALEIVDSLGRVRASITIQPPVEVDGKKYPESVLLRLIESNGKPMVKLGAAENGGGLTLINPSDEGVLIHAWNSGSFVKITTKGKERVIQP
jgi:hypothetical protein